MKKLSLTNQLVYICVLIVGIIFIALGIVLPKELLPIYEENIYNKLKQPLFFINNVDDINTFESENGFVAIKIGEDIENAHIKIRYSGTILEKAGYVISAVSILGIVCFEIFNKRKSK